MRLFKYAVGFLAISLIIAGRLMKKLAMAGNEEVMALGMILFVGGFTFSLIKTLTQQSRKALKRSTIILVAALEFSILAIVFSAFHLEGALVLEILALVFIATYWMFYMGEAETRKLQLRKDRQLAAILFTDIVNFTSMMGDNEDEALLILDQNRNIQKQIIRKHRGKWLKEMGDGSLVIFYTATEAVNAATEIQKAVQKSGKFNVRMGIHISEILFTDTDVFGDGVNVASRISDKASANEICISDAVFQNIRNREDLTVEPVGEMDFKNVAYPLNIYKIVF